MPARDFPRFMDLSKELRDSVWKFAIETPKAIAIRIWRLMASGGSKSGRSREMHPVRIATDCLKTYHLL